MTLQQLKYAVTIADKGSISEASKELFLSQPSLSKGIKDLEKEISLTIFTRTSRGINITPEGTEFLGYARQVILQSDLLENKYLTGTPTKQNLCISTHHYLFAANAFVDLIKQFGAKEYEFTFRETKTSEVIDDVKNLRSEIGLIYLSDFNQSVILKLLKESDIVFSPLFSASPHVFLYKKNPLADKKIITLEQLEDFPYISFEQGSQNSFYFLEEVLGTRTVKKSIKVSDRAAMVNLMIGVNGYTISSGVFPQYLHGEDIVSVALNAEEHITVGTIMHKDVNPSRLGQIYLDALKEITKDI
ncbi:MAG: LysR family transcriptional regulator [Oscillospiraceae bacterium]